tara:strand:- start:212 stop:1156 length:945 start_codon:yes stop_codon:yes gene_type:complete
MKIMINRRPKRSPWGGGIHFVTCLSDFLSSLGYELVFALEPGIDVIIMIDPRPDQPGDDINHLYSYKVQNPNCKILHRINDTDIARNTNFLDNIIIQSNKVSDHTVFISNWVKQYYIKAGLEVNEDRCSTIINGCDTKWYYPLTSKKLGDKIRLITHHWSDNYMKGFDVYNFLDNFCESRKDVEFTYMGRYNKQYVPKNTKIISPKYGPEVGEILRSHDIYVTAARWEACGMHHIEGSSCGLPVLYHRDGGAVPEVCSPHGVEYSDPQTFEDALNKIISNYKDYRSTIDYKNLNIERCLKQYHNALISMTGKKR